MVFDVEKADIFTGRMKLLCNCGFASRIRGGAHESADIDYGETSECSPQWFCGQHLSAKHHSRRLQTKNISV